MKSAIFAIALMISGAAVAQTDLSTEPDMTVASGQVVLPSNADPELDARGIPVISDPAVVPPGFNGTAAGAMGGPLVDETAATGADAGYPACTATITDNCVQTYERGRSSD